MTTFFIGDELECYSTYTPNVYEDGNLAIGGYSRGCIFIPDADQTQYVSAPLTDSVTGLPTATNDVLWTHFRRQTGDRYWDNRPGPTWYDNQGAMKVKEVRSGQFGGKIQIWNGTAFVDASTPYDTPYGDTRVWDFRIKIGAQGLVEVFKDGILLSRWEGDTSAIVNIGEFRMNAIANFTRFHQLILADYSTINHTIRRRNPNGNGAETGWVGDYTQIDDDPQSVIGGDVIYTSQSNTKATFTGQTMAATTAGHVIKAVAVAEFSKNDGTGQFPQNVRPVLSVNGTVYEGPVNAPIGAGWKGGVAFWENNPATGAAWASISDVNATQFGVVAKD